MKAITECRACKGSIVEFLDLGKQYLSDFRDDDTKPPRIPLVAVICEDCKLVQLKHTTPQSEMYHERYGFKSGISSSIKADLDNAVLHAFQYINDPHSWLDIASNDGSLLSFVPEDVYRVGVDPVAFLCKEAESCADLIINDYFNSEIGGEFDVITSISCFYDMPDPSQFVEDVLSVLAPHGVWLIQQNYLLTTLQLSAVDNFCHEHLEYYTLLSLENLLNRFGLEVNEVSISMVNGGSLRTIVSRKGEYDIDSSVQRQRDIEYQYGLDQMTAYTDFASRISTKLNKLHRLLKTIKTNNETVVILAASTRGATIWQAANIDDKMVEYAVERHPIKIGKMFSAIGIPIVSEDFFREYKPDYALMGPWFYGQEIALRELGYIMGGGKFIIPLPEVKVIDKDNINAYLGNLVSDLQTAPKTAASSR